MNEVQYEAQQESVAIGQAIAANLQAILDDHGDLNVRELARTIYKYTDCGPALSVQLHDGTWRFSDDLAGIDNSNVRALRVSSIVEGADEEIYGRVLDLADKRFMEEGGEALAVAEFNHEVEEVNAEACRLWDDVNGSKEAAWRRRREARL